MTFDKLSSYRDSTMTSHPFSYHTGTTSSSFHSLPKDVLEAVEKGDLEEAMRQLRKDEPERRSSSKILFFLGYMGKGIAFVFTLPQAIFQYATSGQAIKKKKVSKALPQEGEQTSQQKNEKTFVLAVVKSLKEAIKIPLRGMASLGSALKAGGEFAKDVGKEIADLGKRILLRFQSLVALPIKWDTAHFTARAQQTHEAISLVVKKLKDFSLELYEKTAPFREKIRDTREEIQEKVSDALKWLKSRTEKILEKVGHRLKTLERVVDPVKEAGTKIAQVAVSAAHVMQVIPQIALQMMHWIYDLSPKADGDFWQNVKRIAKKASRMVSWCGGKMEQGLKQAKRGAEVLGEALSRTFYWVFGRLIAMLRVFFLWCLAKLKVLFRFFVAVFSSCVVWIKNQAFSIFYDSLKMLSNFSSLVFRKIKELARSG